jgi:hypothetical protein
VARVHRPSRLAERRARARRAKARVGLLAGAIVLATGVAASAVLPGAAGGSGRAGSLGAGDALTAAVFPAVSDRAPVSRQAEGPALFTRGVGAAGTPRITLFTAIPATLPASGGSVRLLASVQNAAICRFSAMRRVTLRSAARDCSSGATSLKVTLARNAGRSERTYVFELSVSGRNDRKTTLQVFVRERARGGNGAATAPVITVQPASESVANGASATFTAGASGNPAPTVRWQLSVNGGGSWSNISGATSRTYSTTASAGESGHEYRAVFSNVAGGATTKPATLTVSSSANSAPAVTTQPASQIVLNGRSATLTAAASGSPAPTVQWQVSSNSGVSWVNVVNASSASYSFTPSLSESGYEYRAVFTNVLASTVTSAATLTVEAEASSNWSGYLATAAAGTFKAVNGSWTVPGVSCPAGVTNYSSQWIGIDGGTDNSSQPYQTVEQDGTAADCDSGTPAYYAWYELYGDDSPSVGNGEEVQLPPNSYPVVPGDAMSASVSASVSQSGTTWTLTIADATHPWSGGPYSTSVVWSGGEQASAEWVVERPALCSGPSPSSCSLAPLSDFASVGFTGATATTAGAPESISAAGGQSIEMVGQSDDVLAAPGPLTSSGEGFSDSWFASD